MVAFFEPCQETLLEEVRSVGVIVGARRIDEHVAEAGVPVDVRPPGVVQERLEGPGRNPVVRARNMHAEPHVEAPIAAKIAGRKSTGHENETVNPVPLLSE